MTDTEPDNTDPARIDAFIARWSKASGSELANYQLFLTELIALLDLPPPDPAGDDQSDNAYVFERRVDIQHADGRTSSGRIDLYRRGCYVCEAKQSGLALHSTAWDGAMMKAHAQASHYARNLPAAECRPPFILVTDVGRHLGLYADFTRSGANYIPFPDALSHRIYLDDLHRPAIRARLRRVWLDPMALDPTRRSARVTRAISAKLASLARSLEGNGQAPEQVAGFLMRCLFTMFAEDVGLLPARSFSGLLEEMRTDPAHLPHLLAGLWADMNAGSAFSPVLRAPIPHFNGGLFADPSALPLTREQIDLLIDAARADWKEVEPAIFGTLLERALDPIERHKLGAHYTPRAYVERLVLPTVIEPLRADWANVQASAFQLDQDGKRDQAIDAVRAYHRRLCTVRVLDPACGSGNFLYVTLEHLKRLEGEVLAALGDLGFTQQGLELEGGTVSPEQMLGLETNPRAARIAETVLWIGYLQWHFRTFAKTPPREPLLKDAHNIANRDAVLAWDAIEYARDDQGRPITRWDGRTLKSHPVTGEPVPDEQARVPVELYQNPRPADWPQADFVVGNPPFIGASTMRRAFGDGYLDAAVLAAYGWDDLASALIGRPGGTTPLPDKPAGQAAAEEELLSRLVALNAERAAEEARGRVRWLRPEFQSPDGQGTDGLAVDGGTGTAPEPAAAAKRAWPKGLPDQFQAVREQLAQHPGPASPEQIARLFKRAPTKKVAELLQTLATLGQVRQEDGDRFAA